MSLSEKWFMQRRERNNQRDINGLSIEDASGDLARYHATSAGPIATETAEWLYKNWTTEKIFQLPYRTRMIFFEIVEKEFLSKNSLDLEEN